MRRSKLTQVGGSQIDNSLDIGALSRDINKQTLANAEHGSIIQDANGNFGLVVDMDHKPVMEEDGFTKLFRLGDINDPLFDATAIKTDVTVDVNELMKKKFGEHSEQYQLLLHTQQAFSMFTYGPKGMVLKDDPAAINYQQKIEAIRNGKVRLPTVKEYEEQKKALAQQKNEKKEEVKKPMNTNQEQPTTNIPDNSKITPIVQPQPAVIDPNANVIGVEKITKPEPPKEPVVQVQQQTPQAIQQPPEPQVINIAAVEQQNKGIVSTANNEPDESVVESPVVIKLPASEAPTFIEKLPEDIKEKVSVAKTIEVHAVELANVPVATRRIQSLNEYRSVLPKKVAGNLVQKVLINSGYIATVKGASSLEMASILPDAETGIPDWAKRVQFAYDHLVDTSIGHLTYAKFAQETSSMDIDTLIAATFQASEPDIREMVAVCGNENCRSEYKVKFSISSMWDDSGFSRETIEYFNRIVESKDDAIVAREVHGDAPVMRVDYLQFGDKYFGFKHSDAAMAVNYYPVAQTLAKKYNASVALYAAFVKESRFEENGETFTTNSPEVITQMMLELDDAEQSAIKDYITTKIPEYDQYDFKLKPIGEQQEFVCPKCGRREKFIRTSPESMVFQKASVAGL